MKSSAKTSIFSDEFISIIAEEQLPPEEYFHPTPLLSIKQQRQIYFENLKNFLELTDIKNQFESAVNFILSQLSTLQKDERESIEEELEYMAQLLSLEKPAKLLEIDTNYANFAHQLGLSDSTIKWIHSLARHELENEQFVNAECIYSFLVLFCHNISDFWLERGVASYYAKHYEMAISSYETALIFSKADPEIYLYLAVCLIDCGKSEDAKKMLSQGKQILEMNPTKLEKWQALTQEIEKKLNHS